MTDPGPTGTLGVDIPAEPPVGSVVLDHERLAWQRTQYDERYSVGVQYGGWCPARMVRNSGAVRYEGGYPWPNLLVERGPVTVVHVEPVPDADPDATA